MLSTTARIAARNWIGVTMSDFIRRKDALDAIQKRADEIDSVYSAFWEGLKIAQDVVKKVPSAESERRKGKWIDTTWKHTYKCSECGNFLEFHGVNAGRGDANFCPNCGADMRGDR